MSGERRSSSSSSGEEDGNAAWRAAIDSVASVTDTSSSKVNSNGLATHEEEQNGENLKPKLKLYQIRAQKMLDEMVEKAIEMVTHTDHVVEEDPLGNDVGVRLFRTAPRGIVFDHVDKLDGPRKKPRIHPGEEPDEKSKKFRKQLKSVAVDGAAILETARAASQKSLAKLEAREAAAKAAAKKEEERVVELKKIRGERWLPSMAREMRVSK